MKRLRSAGWAWLVPLLTAAGCNREPQKEEEAKAEPYAVRRAAMVQEQLEFRDIRDPRVLQAMRSVPRERFVPQHLRDDAYRDHPLPIGHDQTISQPYIVAFMTQALRPGPEDKVLEVGTGSGYQAAVLAQLAKTVYSIEIVEPLAKSAEKTLKDLDVTNVHVRAGDGYRGWPEEAPFDGIMVTCAPDHVPQALKEQLKPGGRLVLPVGNEFQELVLLTRTATGYEEKRLLPVRFVPMTGEAQSKGR